MGVDLADMELISKYNKGITYFLCVIDLLSKDEHVRTSKYENVFVKGYYKPN